MYSGPRRDSSGIGAMKGRWWRVLLAALALCLGAAGLTAQAGDTGPGSATEEFRQQLPLGAVTGDAGTLRQRILSATSYRMTAGDTYELQIQLGSDRVNTFPLVLQDDYELEIPYVGTGRRSRPPVQRWAARDRGAASRSRFRPVSSVSCSSSRRCSTCSSTVA